MSNKPIEGSVTVTPTPAVLPPPRAEWVVDTEAKTSTATILGGTAVITRAPSGNFKCNFALSLPPEEGATEPSRVQLSFPLKNCENLVVAQQRAEVLVRENLPKTHRDLADAAAGAEHAETVAAAPADPF